jgi:hypothetical protein
VSEDIGERARRVGENEALFRSVNEQVRGLNETFLVQSTLRVVCECGDQTCIEQLELSPQEYEGVRADAALFVVKPGHEDSDVETVVDQRSGYYVIRKAPGAPQRIARETDPRRG